MSISNLFVPNNLDIHVGSMTANNGPISMSGGKVLEYSGTVTTIDPGSTQVTCFTLPVNHLQIENYFVKFTTSGINTIGVSCSTSTLYRIKVSAGSITAPVVVGTPAENIDSFPVGTVGQVVSNSGFSTLFQVKNTNASNVTRWTWNIQIIKASYPT